MWDVKGDGLVLLGSTYIIVEFGIVDCNLTWVVNAHPIRHMGEVWSSLHYWRFINI